MNKKFAIISILFAAQAYAQTTIQYELLGEEIVKNHSNQISLSSLNKKLNAKGLPGFPDLVVFNKNGAAYQAKLMKQLDAANSALGHKFEANISNQYIYDMPSLCYRGAPSGVRPVILALMGSVLEEDQGIQGIRYGNKTFITNPKEFFANNKEYRQNYKDQGMEAQMKAWDNYDTESDSVLVISDLGPQGDGSELYATEIKPCK